MGSATSQKQRSTSPSSLDASSSAHQQRLSSGAAPLRRGQACQSCRRRKLKCDAVRPICGTCEKSRRAAALSNHASPVPDGDCIYDDGPILESQMVAETSSTNSPRLPKKRKTTAAAAAAATSNGVNGDRRMSSAETAEPAEATDSRGKQSNDARIAQLQATVADLEGKLRKAISMQQLHHHYETGTTPKRWQSRASSREPADSAESFRPVVPILSMLSPLSGREEKHRMRYFQRPAKYDGASEGFNSSTSSKSIPMQTSNQPAEDQKHISPDDALPTIDLDAVPLADETFMQLLWPGWSSDLPSAETVTALCETFFRSHPLRTLVYKPSFMSGLLLPPKHPHRPHDSLIHAILCAAADFSPFFGTSMPGMQSVRDQFVELLSDPFSRPNSHQPQSPDVLTFKEFHLSKSRQKVERSLITDFRNPLDWMAACVIVCYVLWNDGRFVESYFLSGFMARATAPAGLDKLPSRHHNPASKNRPTPGIFGEANGLEEHERRMVFWHAFITDQYTSGPPGFYENMLNEQAISTHLPCRLSDFLSGNDVPPNPQKLTSTDLFTSGHLDDFTLHVKSVVLLRRAGTLICRSQSSRSKPPGIPIVDKHIDEFLSTMPSKTPLHQASSDGLNAFANTSLALIYLHEPFLSSKVLCTVKEEGSSSASIPHSNSRVCLAVENVLKTLHQLLNSSLDFALLHPQMFLTWSICGRMMGKDLIVLQQAQQSSSKNGSKQEGYMIDDIPGCLQKVLENLNLIVEALRRGGVKSSKAKRCAEMVSYVRSGHIHESYLAHLLYLDGVIPVDEMDPNAAAMAAAATNGGTDLSALNQTLMSMTASSNHHDHRRGNGSSIGNDLSNLSSGDALDQLIPQVFTSPGLLNQGDASNHDHDETGDLLNFASM